MILTGIGLAAASVARNLTEVYAAYGLGVGLGIGCSYVPAVGAVTRWFVRRRGFASGLAVSGIGVGTLVVPPLASLSIDSLGWRETYLILGVFAIVIGAGMALLIEDGPRGRGLGADGDPPMAGGEVTAAAGVPLGRAITTRRFIGLYAACFICSFGLFVPFVHLVPYALDHGIPQSAAVLLVGVIGVGSTAGRFFLGGLADRLGRPLSFLAMFAGMGFSFVIWLFSASLWELGVFAFVYGVFYGGFVALAPAVRPKRIQPHRHPLHQRCVRHTDRADRRRVRIRHQAQLYAADRAQHRRLRSCNLSAWHDVESAKIALGLGRRAQAA